MAFRSLYLRLRHCLQGPGLLWLSAAWPAPSSSVLLAAEAQTSVPQQHPKECICTCNPCYLWLFLRHNLQIAILQNSIHLCLCQNDIPRAALSLQSQFLFLPLGSFETAVCTVMGSRLCVGHTAPEEAICCYFFFAKAFLHLSPEPSFVLPFLIALLVGIWQYLQYQAGKEWCADGSKCGRELLRFLGAGGRRRKGLCQLEED